MKILICGLSGTGKTALSHIIAEKYGFNVKNDFSIFKELGNPKKLQMQLSFY